ncbi:MAG TPA: PIG-L family deacetylase [Chitinophagaceae bacterium]|nr:PIG-L family deacetylase [Chitinophagaceae bacterium]
MRKRILFLLFLTYIFSSIRAQAPQTLSASEIYLGLKKLKVLGSVLYVAAHPDDENTRLLAYLAKERLFRTGYMSMTRGDGGQNLIGEEQGIELGLIRTQELLAARRIDGAEQFFSRAFDFGYSKSTDEALTTWDKEKILSDVVWVIRKFRPDVIITRFPEDSRAGHGHHSASAVLAREAFIAAADPTRFPEQLKYGVNVWQAKRIVLNGFNFGGINITAENQLKTDVGVFNAILGKSYGEIAAESRSQHKSQGFGVPRTRGQQFEYFTPILGDTAKKDLLDGVITDWSRVEGGAAIAAQVDDIIRSYSFDNPSLSVKSLVKLYGELLKMPDTYWRNQKIEEVQRLIEACSGLWMEGTTSEQYVAQGDTLKINYSVNVRGNVKAVLKKYSLLDGINNEHSRNELNRELEPNKNFNFSKTINIAANHELTQPYWLKEEMNKGYFNVANQQMIGKAQSEPSLSVIFNVAIEGQEFNFYKPIQYKFTDPVKGELFQPLVITPPVTIKPSQNLVVFDGIKQKLINASVKAFTNINLTDPKSISQTTPIGYVPAGYGTFNKGDEKSFPVLISASNNISSLNLYAGNYNQYLTRELHEVKYDHIPNIAYFTNALIKIASVDYKTTSKSVGYIPGAGDKVPEALLQMGYTVTILGEKDLNLSSLKKFDAVVAGVRAYNVHEFMVNAYDALMDYVKQGGVYIVQYNTNSFAGPLANGKIGPAPFTVSRNRITDEAAKVNFLLPNHPVLNYPNKITEKDFEGWIQERSIYEAEKVDSSFASILSFNDANEKPTTGSLIVNHYGKGKFVYTGLVFFRELPAGVPGAYRLFANLLARPAGEKVKERSKK